MWRAKYGQGMAALLDDTYGNGKIPAKAKISIIKTGVAERARETGLIGDTASSLDCQRAGSLLVLCGWAGFMLASALFAKFTDNWGASNSSGDRSLLRVMYGTVQWGGAAGALVVLIAALIVLPSLIRMFRSGDWTSLRRPVMQALCAGTVFVAGTAGLILWAHHLPYRDRNGGLVSYEIFVACWSVAVGVCVAVGTSAAVSITQRLELSRRKVQSLSTMAMALTLSMVAILAAMIIWWRIEASHAPAFMRSGIGNGFIITSSTFPPALVVASILMLIGLAAAISGTLRVAHARRAGGGSHSIGGSIT
jgi:hypothetical protein